MLMVTIIEKWMLEQEISDPKEEDLEYKKDLQRDLRILYLLLLLLLLFLMLLLLVT